MTTVTSDDASVEAALDVLRSAFAAFGVAVQTTSPSGDVVIALGDRIAVRIGVGDLTAIVAGNGDTASLDLDPEVVAAAIEGVGVEHLDAVMAGPFREPILAEVFRRFPEFLRIEKAARVQLVVGFEVGGRPDGGSDRWVVEIDRGSCRAAPDPEADRSAAAVLELTGAQFLRLVLGHLNPVRGVLGGEVRVRGELLKALALNSVMRIPGS